MKHSKTSTINLKRNYMKEGQILETRKNKWQLQIQNNLH